MADSTCTTDGCLKPVKVKSRGLCSTHYNRTQPNRHRKILIPCDACGQPCSKEARAQRYAHAYCSELCRDYSRWGASKCAIPQDHMARCYEQTCRWVAPAQLRAIECDWCGDPVSTTRGTQRFCRDACKEASKRRRRRAREHGAPGEYRFSDVMRQYRAQGYACAYCETRCVGLPDPEHVVPLSRGGRNDMSNIVAACRPCNADKRDLTLDEWAADRARRGLPPVRTELTGPIFRALAA